MRITSIINLKGGVAKTISAANVAHILATIHKKRVLLIDNDKQGNVSKMFELHSYDRPSISDILTERSPNLAEIISKTKYENLDIIPANMTLLRANFQIQIDTSKPRETRLRKQLENLKSDYDFCVIDCAPDLNISVINALVASDDVLIPIKIDKFAFDGLAELLEQIENTREGLNPALTIAGAFVTMYQNNPVNSHGEENLRKREDLRIFNTHIRRTEKIDESTFATAPILDYSPSCGAAKDYLAFVLEYLNHGSDSDTQK